MFNARPTRQDKFKEVMEKLYPSPETLLKNARWTDITGIESVPFFLQDTYIKNRMRALKIYGDYLVEFKYYKAMMKMDENFGRSSQGTHWGWTYTNYMAPNLQITTDMEHTHEPMLEYEFRMYVAQSFNYKMVL